MNTFKPPKTPEHTRRHYQNAKTQEVRNRCASILRAEVKWTASWDPSMVHIAEWIKYFGAFFNLEAEAEAHFNQVSGKGARAHS